MIRIFYRKGQQLFKEKRIENVPAEYYSNITWVDLHYATTEEQDAVEQTFNINFQSQATVAEIESSSRYTEDNETLYANSNFLIQDNGIYVNATVSFILKENVLFTYRNADLKSFAETLRKIKANDRLFTNGSQIMLSIFEARIDFDADFIEALAREISHVSRNISHDKSLSEVILLKINSYQENTIMIRESITDKQRMLSSLLKSDLFPRENSEKLRILLKDVQSLLEHTAFSFERLEYLQHTFLGLVNIEQNRIIKRFTIASVVFMPPTLIASMYGMNFRYMPELSWDLGYPMAIVMMILSSFITLYFFRKKKWL